MKRKALGKGLRSLIPTTPPTVRPAREAQPEPLAAGLPQIDVDRIQPNRDQPREHFEPTALEELAASLKAQGLLQPVIVRPTHGGRYELIAGERRWRAAQIAGLLKIPAVIRDVSDDKLLELALIENLQREELNALEEARAYQTLIDDLDLTQQDVADRVGKQRATIANALRLLNLPQAVQELIRAGQLSAGHAKALAALANTKAQVELAQRVAREGLSVRVVETLVRRAGQPAATVRAPEPERDPNVAAAEDTLQRAVGTKVRILQGKSGAGRLELHFFSGEELDRVYQLILRAAKRRSEEG